MMLSLGSLGTNPIIDAVDNYTDALRVDSMTIHPTGTVLCPDGTTTTGICGSPATMIQNVASGNAQSNQTADESCTALLGQQAAYDWGTGQCVAATQTVDQSCSAQLGKPATYNWTTGKCEAKGGINTTLVIGISAAFALLIWASRR